jgi:hypothetical protein
MTTRELLNLAEAKGLDIKRVGERGPPDVRQVEARELTDEQRRAVAEELELVPVTT